MCQLNRYPVSALCIQQSHSQWQERSNRTLCEFFKYKFCSRRSERISKRENWLMARAIPKTEKLESSEFILHRFFSLLLDESCACGTTTGWAMVERWQSHAVNININFAPNQQILLHYKSSLVRGERRRRRRRRRRWDQICNPIKKKAVRRLERARPTSNVCGIYMHSHDSLHTHSQQPAQSLAQFIAINGNLSRARSPLLECKTTVFGMPNEPQTHNPHTRTDTDTPRILLLLFYIDWVSVRVECDRSDKE